MAATIDFSARKLPVILSADVVVCGGGVAGVSAAAAAARLGSKVLMVEQLGCLGGLGAAGLVPCFCPFTDGEKPVVRGIGEEVLTETAHRMGIPVEYDWMPIHAESLKSAFDALVTSSGAVLRLSTRIVGVVAADGHVEAVVVSTHDGLAAVAGRTFIDATGDGDVAAWAGAPFELGGPGGCTQSPTLCFTFANIDWLSFDAKRKESGPRPDQLLWLDDVARGSAPLPDRHLTTGILRTGRSTAGINAGHVFGANGIDEASVTGAMLQGRAMAWTFIDWYRKTVPGCAGAELSATASILGVRETRRIMGEYVLNYADYVARSGFEDEIGRLSYPIDVHSSTVDGETKTQEEFHSTRYKPGESYGIPYRCLVPRELENVLVAGRCISTDRPMQGSTRVMPGCFVTGQAAGVAASLAAKSAEGLTRFIDVSQLRSTLRSQNAYLP